MNLIKSYSQTLYGREHNAESIVSISDFQRLFPIVKFDGLRPMIDKVREGHYEALLAEPPTNWVMTRGTTGRPKVIPITKAHLDQIFSCGARAIVNYALRRKDYEILAGGILNLSFPSMVGTIQIGERLFTYGYSSGTYSKLNPALARASLLPKQEEIDRLGSGIRKEDWTRRFDLFFERTRDKNIMCVMGVTHVILEFARYLKKTLRRNYYLIA
ncbi:MAG: GH3 auxin-responsive promoter family protein [Nitrososphaerales archaeon]|nr:GH3 auxin-responsive promoter family protein [Nitrososphaerales archaeon]